MNSPGALGPFKTRVPPTSAFKREHDKIEVSIDKQSRTQGSLKRVFYDIPMLNYT